MSWFWSVPGFLALFFAVSLAASFALAMLRRISRVTPTAIATSQDLQAALRALLSAGHDGEVLYLVWFPARFEVRVRRSTHVARPTLDVEVRDAGANRGHYAEAKACLAAEALEFTERELHGRRQTQSLRLTWPDGGPLAVTAAANAIGVLTSALPATPDKRCAASCGSPQLWHSSRTLAI